MKKSKLITLMSIATLFIAANSYSATLTDTIDANSNFSNNFFVPDEASKYSKPYYRGWKQDWEWQHNPVNTAFTKANLNISAFDVDFSKGEIDDIYAWNNQTSDWELLGALAGADDIFSFTDFSLDSSWFDEISLGLLLKMDIASKAKNWVVTLAKSSLSIDGGALPPPAPSAVPLPAAVWLFGSALVGFLGIRRKSKQVIKS
jgi:hypothetical protein